RMKPKSRSLAALTRAVKAVFPPTPSDRSDFRNSGESISSKSVGADWLIGTVHAALERSPLCGKVFRLRKKANVARKGAGGPRRGKPGAMPVAVRPPTSLFWTKGEAMDIFTWLRRDHVEILNLIGEGTREARAQGAERWDIHVRIEENFLFPFLRSEPGLRHSLNRAV